MEGFDSAALDKLLGLGEKGLRSAVIMTLGYRDTANDWLVNLKKVRRARSDFVREIP
jgi:nitroreductase